MSSNEEVAMQAVKLMIDILLKMAESGDDKKLEERLNSLDLKTTKLLLAGALGEVAARRGMKLGKPSIKIQDHIDGL
jgi:hypothetical protein